MRTRLALCAVVAIFGLTAAKCTPEQIGAVLRDYWSHRDVPMDACRNDGQSTVLTAIPCNGQPTHDIVCMYDIPHAHQDPDYCLAWQP